MRLATVVASYPVFAVEVLVTHQTPRRPTAFEQMVLRLILRAEVADALAGVGLRELFEGMLGVGDAHLLLNPTVYELISLDVLRPPAQPERIEAPLRDWGITEAGRALFQRGMLPGRPRYESLQYSYEPLADTLQQVRDGELRGASSGSTIPRRLHLDATFPPVDLAQRIGTSLRAEHHQWLEAATEIMEIEVTPSPEATRWREAQLSLDCSPDGRLDLQAKGDDAMTRWLRQARPEDVWQRLIGPTLGGPMLDNAGAGQFDELAHLRATEELRPITIESAAVISPWYELPATRRAKLDAKSPRSGLLLRPAAKASTEADQTGAAACLDLIEVGASRVEGVKIAAPGIGLRWPTAAGLPQELVSVQVMRPGAEPLVTLEGMATLLWAGQPRQAALRMQLETVSGSVVWQALLPQLEDAIRVAPSLEYLPLALWFEPPSAVLDRWLAGAAEHSPEDWFRALGAFVAALNQRWPGGEPLDSSLWTERILPHALTFLERHLPQILELEEALALINATACVPRDRRVLVLMLLERTAPLSAVEDLLKLRKAATGLPGIFFPASLLGDALRMQLVKETLHDTESSVGAHALSEPLREFGQVFKRNRSFIKPVLMDPNRALKPDWVKAARTQPGRLLEAVTALETAIEVLCLALGKQDAPAVRYLQSMRACLQSIRSWMADALASSLPGARRAIVLDTSSLIARPSLLGQMPESDVPVIPKRVLEELDGLKTSRADQGPEGELRAKSARQAIAAIEAARGRVLFEPSRRDQCAQDWPATPDNEILSVAVFHALNDVVLVSDDRNLRNKAQSESLNAMDAAHYGSATMTVRPAPQPPKPQTRTQTTR